ncbi:integrase core domain-containing protein [Micromonospora sp. NBC_01405]|uniref:integrase core domain-containing protein n=1 Tax=Micromonospora sp. NBC_01405 TaxID=2903589 RepID=UPI0038698BC9
MLRRPVESAQYVSAQHARLAHRHDIRLSVGRRGQCWDNAVAESFFATIKTELLHRQAWPTHQAARQAIFEYIESCTTPAADTQHSATSALRLSRPPAHNRYRSTKPPN